MSPPNRLENLRSLRMSNVDVAFATSFGTLVSGLFLVGFIQRLGGSDMWIGLLSGIPSLVGVLQIPGAIWGRGFTSYKRFVTPGGVFWRLGYLPLIALPFLPAPAALKLTLLMGCVLFASVATTIVNPVYNEWIAELVPSESRGSFFARRNAIATAVGAIVGIFGALLLDAFRGHDRPDLGFTVVYALGIVCSVISLIFYLQMQDLPRPNPVRQGLRDGIRAVARPFRDVNFRRVLAYLAVGLFGQQFAGNLFSAYALESLHLNYKIVQGTAVSLAIGNVLSARLWGFLSDKYGNKPVLVIAAALLATNLIPWLLTMPGHAGFNTGLLLTTHVLMGVFWCGINLCQFNLILATAPAEDRANYIGAGMTVISLVGGIAPLCGAFMLTSLRPVMPAVEGYKLVFIATLVVRVAATFFLIPIAETGASALRETLDDLRRVTPRGMRAMRSLSRSTDVGRRADAIGAVGEEGFTLATDEVIKALHDPSPRVRRRAAEALARLEDPRATEELIHQVEEHPDLLEEETVEALGFLGDPAAVPTLIRTMQSPRSLLRRAAARALGRIGDDAPEVIEALIRAAGDEHDVDLRRAAVQTLRRLEVSAAEPVIRRTVLDAHPSVRVAAAETVAELQMISAAPELREALRRYRDEASSETAYALGVVGTTDDLPIILAEAAASRSIITRRRCLLGVARQLGVEREAYRLMIIEGMERDQALMQMLAPAIRRQHRLRAALSRYSSGDEPGAIRAYAQLWPDLPPAVAEASSVEDLFLAVTPAVAKALG